MPGKWKEAVELIGMLAIVVSLVFLALEVRQSRQVGVSDFAANSIDVNNQIRELLLANTDIWTRGCSGEELSTPERAAYAQMFRAYVLNLYWGWSVGGDTLVEIDKYSSVNKYAANYHRYRGFASMSDDQQDWLKNTRVNTPEHAAEFSKAIGERIMELRSIEPNPDFDPALCGL